MVLHSCGCVYLWYAPTEVATFIADHFASFYALCNKQKKKKKKKKKKNRKYIKINVKCFMLVC